MNRSQPDGLQTFCRECGKSHARNYYATNGRRQRVQIAIAKKRRIGAAQDWYCRYLTEHPCLDCGETDILVLDADHLRDKDAGVSDMVAGGASIERIMAELAKCDIVCSNCHRRRTASRSATYRSKYLASVTQWVA